jgi:hypothetical protein
LSLHVWSFRKPDPADPGEPQRLPGIVKGLPAPEISEICVAKLPNGRPVNARLTRYPRRSTVRPPILLIPGYSASGTTFAHPALDPHMAGYLERGRDVWISIRHQLRDADGAHALVVRGCAADIPAAVNIGTRWANGLSTCLHLWVGHNQHGAARATRVGDPFSASAKSRRGASEGRAVANRPGGRVHARQHLRGT